MRRTVERDDLRVEPELRQGEDQDQQDRDHDGREHHRRADADPGGGAHAGTPEQGFATRPECGARRGEKPDSGWFTPPH
ncbi:hypothetical protein TPB0596_06340 [Tsukamurella pulmonis]|nr:hypothetical protein TPB0596_06340 [Tsukamurella pulmonis]